MVMSLLAGISFISKHDERFGSCVATRIIDLDQGAGKTGSVSEDVKEKGSAD